MDWTLLFILVLAVALGWLLGRAEYKKTKDTRLPSLDMLAGDRQSDTMQAILDMAQREEAIELQLNLGTFYRRRGELDKAVSIHQSLFARPDLDKELAGQVQFALASDYLQSGLFDRAERLLLELLKTHQSLKGKVIDKLVVLYEEEQDWENILSLASEVKHFKNIKSVAYACCELANRAIKKEQWREAKNYIDRALKLDGRCIWALILESQLHDAQGFPNKVVASLKEALQYDPSQLFVILPKLKQIFESRHRPHELEKILEELWLESPMPLTLHSYAEHLAEHESLEDAIAQLTYSIAKVPTIEGFRLLLEKRIEKGEALPLDEMQHLKDVLDKLREKADQFFCKNCGLETDLHHWRCPSCKQWETMVPRMTLSNLTPNQPRNLDDL